MRKASVIVPIVGLLAITGCTSFEALNDRKEARYADTTAFSAAADAVPNAELVPDDATGIAAAYYTDRPGSIITFVSPTGPADCQPGPLAGEPLLEASWWPSTYPAEGTVCGDWQVFAVSTTWYGWTNASE